MIRLFIILSIFIFISPGEKIQKDSSSVSSPDGNIRVEFWIQDGNPYYSANYNEKEIVQKSALGYILKDNDTLTDHLEIVSTKNSSFDETWEQVWGQQHLVRNHYNEQIVHLAEKDGGHRSIQIVFRVFDDGFGFRFVVSEQPNLDSIVIMDELTEFNMTENLQAWWIPAYRDNRYEYLYKKSPINSLDTVHTPLTMERADGIHVSIHEANLTNYAGMTIAALDNNKLKCDLTPWNDGTKVKTKTPMQSPWRTITIANNAGELITSNLVLNLNEPNKLEDVSWITPTKYLGIWWGMHIGKYTFWESDNHGSSTNNSISYIDYCIKLGIDHLLIEGWNTGWTPAWYENKLHVFSFTESTGDFDFDRVSTYSSVNNVHLIGYHETGSNIDNYMAQIDSAMQMYQAAGMHDVKIGQVGSRLMMTEWHYGQYGVNYYRTVLEKAAKYQLTVNFHEPVKPTGLQRTYPNLMSGEGARGMEYNAWSEGNPPEHTVILPFTRLLGGPMDYTPGIFSIKPTHVHTTLAKQLALYLTIYSPIQMLADLPENYDGNPAFKFLQEVPVDWEYTQVINAKIGDYYTVARKDLNSDDWYLGSISGENEREFEIELSFLDKDKTYRAEIYADAEDAEFDKNPEAFTISSMEVNSGSHLKLHLAKGGGEAIRFVAL
ncbi:MAG: alpha-glucosidase [Bacteroidetes bacterium CG18_big_fil_WC_8_21_14_2_50_41_14]|nr:MAG: alpha-glucosidase [Bacteroidetes bacterium CG18_big_fil_WC_8_21_14_2_50_41_14]PJB55172.1 MAG: alpha-glucosidase [Bacteroidetes bacterium CG_4_9_14_3_um_filter_41_19]